MKGRSPAPLRPLALFDSGVGGLSVAREIRRALPSEELLYVADTAYCPYGDRPEPEVRERALAVRQHRCRPYSPRGPPRRA